MLLVEMGVVEEVVVELLQQKLEEREVKDSMGGLRLLVVLIMVEEVEERLLLEQAQVELLPIVRVVLVQLIPFPVLL